MFRLDEVQDYSGGGGIRRVILFYVLRIEWVGSAAFSEVFDSQEPTRCLARLIPPSSE